jgi:pimeloyl-ACP methyl ester carboxylesterase
MSKPPLILVPGLTCTAALWAPQMAALADVADIAIGDHRQDDTLEDIARRILAAAPARFALAGLSMGGYIAFEILRQAPERVSHLALLDTSARPFDPSQTAVREALIREAKTAGMDAPMRQLLPVFVHPDRLSDSALVHTVMAMGRETGPIVFERQQRALMARRDSRPMLASIACPTLVLVGAQDVLTPVADHEEIASGIPGSRLVVVPHCGHLSTLERPHAVCDALRAWLVA